MERSAEVSVPGIFAAIALSFVATIGQAFTTQRCCDRFNAVWLTVFAISLVILSAAAVNFDPKRWLA